MSDLQQVAECVANIVLNTKSSITLLHASTTQLDKLFSSLQLVMRDTSRRDYTDILKQMSDAGKKIKTAQNCLMQAGMLGETWINAHATSSSGGSTPASAAPSDFSDEADLSDDESKHLVLDTNERWKNTLNSTDELINIYREEMIAHGVVDGTLLTRFLKNQHNKMLQYEAALIDYESGNREPLTDDEIYKDVIVGKDSPYDYSNLVDDFGDYCLEQINSWIPEINPNSNNDPRRKINCGQCAAAVFNRLNGDDSAVAGLGTYSISEMNRITGKVQTTMTPSQIENYLRSQGAGAHVVVGVDRSSGAGHWFNAFFDGRKVYTIESQGGYLNGWPPDYGDVIHWDVSI